MPSFMVNNGLGGVTMGCIKCGADLERDPESGNYRCPTPDCGAGSLSSKDGIETVVDEHGNVTLKSGKPS